MQCEPHAPAEDDENKPFLPDDPLELQDELAGRSKLRLRLVLVLFSIILAVETGASMTSSPTTRIYESIACRQYYEAHDNSKIGAGGHIPEELCKNAQIQGEVAIVTGYRELFDALVGMSQFDMVPHTRQSFTTAQAFSLLFHMGCWPTDMDENL